MADHDSNTVLVTVPRFASIDEIASAIAFARILNRAGEDVRLYLGHYNYPLRLQKAFPATDLKFYQPDYYQNELQLNLHLPNNEVKGVRWEQTNGELKILIEVTNATNEKPEVEVAEKRKFAQIFLLGNSQLRLIEAYNLVGKYTDLDGSKLTLLDADANLGSIAEVIIRYCHRNKLNLMPADRFALVRAAYYGRLQNLSFTKPLLPDLIRGTSNSELAENRILEPLSLSDYEQVQNFYRSRNDKPVQIDDLTELMALIRLTPQLNPLALIEKTARDGLTFRATGMEGDLYLTTNLNFRPKNEKGKFHYRQMNGFLIGMRLEKDAADVEQEIKLDLPVETTEIPQQKPVPVSAAKADKQQKLDEKPSETIKSTQPERNVKKGTIQKQDPQETPADYIPLQPASIYQDKNKK